VVKVLYDTGTPAAGETWGPSPNSWAASKGYPGFTCLGVVDATARIMLARVESPEIYIGKADTDIAKNASGTVSQWVGTPGGSEFDSGVNILNCYNFTGKAIKANDLVSVYFINGVAYIGTASMSAIARAIVYGTDAEIAPGGTGEAKKRNADDDGWVDDVTDILNTTDKTIREDDEIVIGLDELGRWIVIEAPGQPGAISRAKVYDAEIDENATGEVYRWDSTEADWSSELTEIRNTARPIFKDEQIVIGQDDSPQWLTLGVVSHTLEGLASEAISKGSSGTVVLDGLTDSPEIVAWSYLGEVADGDIVYVIWFAGKWRIIAAECPEEEE
jgi:hypothetical protein